LSAVLPRPVEIIADLLSIAEKALLGGASKTNKTWMALDLALCVAAGIPWLDRVCMRCEVLYVNFEVLAPYFQERLARVASARGIKDLTNEQLRIVNARGLAISGEDLGAPLQKHLDDIKFSPKLIVLDPLYKMSSGLDENSAGDMAQVMKAIEDIAARYGAAVVIVHHFSKGNQSSKSAIDRVSGSGVFGRDPDVLLNLTAHEQDNCFTFEATQRNRGKGSSSVLRFTFPVFAKAPELDPSKLSRGGSGKKEVSAEAVLDVLREYPGDSTSSTEWFRACVAKGVLGSKSTFTAKVNELRDLGRLCIEMKGRREMYSPAFTSPTIKHLGAA
jgi:AAA domain